MSEGITPPGDMKEATATAEPVATTEAAPEPSVVQQCE